MASTPHLLPLELLWVRLSANCHLLSVPAETLLFSFPSMMALTPPQFTWSITYLLFITFSLPDPSRQEPLGTRALVLSITHSTQSSPDGGSLLLVGYWWWQWPKEMNLGWWGWAVAPTAENPSSGFLLFHLFLPNSTNPAFQGQTRPQPRSSWVTITGLVWSLTV